MTDYTAKPSRRWSRCIICGEKITEGEALVGGQMKRGGTRCAHKECWEQEQNELRRRST